MVILSQQFGISEKATNNGVTVNPGARSLTAPSGYYSDGGKYPDDRPTWDNTAVLTTEQLGGETIIAGQIGGSQHFNKVSDRSGLDRAISFYYTKTGADFSWTEDTWLVSWENIDSVYAPTTFNDGITTSQTAGSLS